MQGRSGGASSAAHAPAAALAPRGPCMSGWLCSHQASRQLGDALWLLSSTGWSDLLAAQRPAWNTPLLFCNPRHAQARAVLTAVCAACAACLLFSTSTWDIAPRKQALRSELAARHLARGSAALRTACCPAPSQRRRSCQVTAVDGSSLQNLVHWQPHSVPAWLQSQLSTPARHLIGLGSGCHVQARAAAYQLQQGMQQARLCDRCKQQRMRLAGGLTRAAAAHRARRSLPNCCRRGGAPLLHEMQQAAVEVSVAVKSAASLSSYGFRN